MSRCGHCKAEGHNRRRCPDLAVLAGKPDEGGAISFLDMIQMPMEEGAHLPEPQTEGGSQEADREKTKVVPPKPKTAPPKTKVVPPKTKTAPPKAKTAPVKAKVVPIKPKIVPIKPKTTPVKAKVVPIKPKIVPIKAAVAPSKPKPYKGPKPLTLKWEEAMKLAHPSGQTWIMGPKGVGQPMIYCLISNEDLKTLFRTSVQIGIEPKRKAPTGFQVVLYGKNKPIAYLECTATEAWRQLWGGKTAG